ncbi:hypothetical protein [Aminobacter sp. MDW-2]|uniref:hypothetical protein n=1 Tax=Aminobacter sp. MDW-2 TaxID=2666139 RepID=UPI0012B13850|nr:hypothetical protein [Aminobacter sp. MDW-2]MRX32801.1 hypothetical protein [Aminobacter sp. MDW-2]QNH34538.1 hypothetical protein H5P29_00870 [Aminobacter sp. MDW-2]
MTPAVLLRLMERPLLGKTLQLGPEDRICIEFANRLRAWTIEGRLSGVWTHIGNELAGGTKNASIRYAIARALGLISGATDYVFLWDGGCGVIEAKAGKNDLTPRQVDFASWCAARRVPHRVMRSADEGEGILREWGALR